MTTIGGTLGVVHVTDSLDRRSGGPSVSISESVSALSQVAGISVTVVAQSSPGASNVLPRAPDVQTIIVASNSRLVRMTGLRIKAKLSTLLHAPGVSLVHAHGVWLPVNHFTSKAAHAVGKPLVLQPRGMLEAWSLQHAKLKKQVAMWAYQRRDLEEATCFVATSEDEYASIRALGLRQPIAVIPNGVSLEGLGHAMTSCPPKKANKIALFLSRVHPKKGIPDLLRAWARVRAADWLLQIAGPDELGHTQECQVLARTLRVEDSVQFLGPVYGPDKHALYQSADLFVLPTYSENFGNVVAEALSFGLPVITTKGTPWRDLVSHHCGWWIDCGVDSLSQALLEAFKMTPMDRQQMGARGRQYVERYSWERTAEMTAQYYRWILKCDGRADFIYTA